MDIAKNIKSARKVLSEHPISDCAFIRIGKKQFTIPGGIKLHIKDGFAAYEIQRPVGVFKKGEDSFVEVEDNQLNEALTNLRPPRVKAEPEIPAEVEQAKKTLLAHGYRLAIAKDKPEGFKLVKVRSK